MSTTFRLDPLRQVAPASIDLDVGKVAAAVVGAPLGNAGGTPLPTSAAVPDKSTASWPIVIASYAAVAAVWAVAVRLIHDNDYSAVAGAPVAGLTIFAVFFVAAQAIERMLEPVAAALDPKLGEAAADAQAAAQKSFSAASRGTDTVENLKTALTAAATAKAAAATSQSNRKVTFWAAATCVGLLTGSVLKLYLLRTVGIAHLGRMWEVLATGLVIGSGTKPLHDFVGLVTAKAAAAKGAVTDG